MGAKAHSKVVSIATKIGDDPTHTYQSSHSSSGYGTAAYEAVALARAAELGDAEPFKIPGHLGAEASALSAAEVAAVDQWAGMPIDRDTANGALLAAGRGVGSYCLRRSESGDSHMVLCVLLESLEIAQYRIFLTGPRACSLLDVPGAPHAFRGLHACLAQLKVPGFDGALGAVLTECIPVAVADAGQGSATDA